MYLRRVDGNMYAHEVLLFTIHTEIRSFNKSRRLWRIWENCWEPPCLGTCAAAAGPSPILDCQILPRVLLRSLNPQPHNDDDDSIMLYYVYVLGITY